MLLKDLDFEKVILDKLFLNNIDSIGKLWQMNRKELKNIGFTYEEIKKIAIKLQLRRLDLNKKINCK